MVEGKLQCESGVMHVIISHCFDMSKLFRQLIPAVNDDPPLFAFSQTDERIVDSVRAGVEINLMPETETMVVFPAGRNFK